MNSEKSTDGLVAVTIGETGRRLSCSVMTVRRLIERRELLVVRLGRSVRVFAASIEKLAAREGCPPSVPLASRVRTPAEFGEKGGTAR